MFCYPRMDFESDLRLLFDKYHVDFVLQGREHTYQRSYPLKHNVNNSITTNPIVVTDNIRARNPVCRVHEGKLLTKNFNYSQPASAL